MGETPGGGDTRRPVGHLADGQSEGATSADGRIADTYIYGLFGLAAQRVAWLAPFGVAGRGIDHGASVEAALDEIVTALERHLAVDAPLEVAVAERTHGQAV